MKIFKSSCPKCNENKITLVHTDTVFVELPSKLPNQFVDNKVIENIVKKNLVKENTEDDGSVYEPEFSLEGVEQDEVFADRLLKTKTVKVRTLNLGPEDITLPEDFFHFFEIQQWSTPIINKITYYRDKNMVKIKGMDIDYFSVVFYKADYFLETNNRYYAIPETQYFEKLTIIQKLQ
jgi:hypothetical protein